MEIFAKIVNSFKLLAIFTKSFILVVWQGFEYTCLSKLNKWIDSHLYSFTEADLPIGFPKVKTHPSNIHNTQRKQIDFHCIVAGKGPLQITWYKNRTPVKQDANHKVSMSMTDQDFSSNFMINNISIEDKGFYQCVANNKYGQGVSKQASIRFDNRKLGVTRQKRVSYQISLNLSFVNSNHMSIIS